MWITSFSNKAQHETQIASFEGRNCTKDTCKNLKTFIQLQQCMYLQSFNAVKLESTNTLVTAHEECVQVLYNLKKGAQRNKEDTKGLHLP